MLAEERHRVQRAVAQRQCIEFAHHHHVRETERLRDMLHRRVHQLAVGVLRHHDGLHAVAQLQQRLEHEVVVMRVRDHHVVDHLGQVVVGEARRLAVECVADERIEQQVLRAGLHQHAGMAEITDTGFVRLAARGRRRLAGKQRGECSGLGAGRSAREQRVELILIEPVPARRAQCDGERIRERQVEQHVAARGQARCAEAEWPAVVGLRREREGLQRAGIVSVVEQGLHQARIGQVAALIRQLDQAAQALRQPCVERVERVAVGLLERGGERVEIVGQAEQRRAIGARGVDQRLHGRHVGQVEPLGERAAAHAGVVRRLAMQRRVLDERRHDGEVVPCQIRGGRWIDEPGVRVPAIDQRLDLDMLLQEVSGCHGSLSLIL